MNVDDNDAEQNDGAVIGGNLELRKRQSWMDDWIAYRIGASLPEFQWANRLDESFKDLLWGDFQLHHYAHKRDTWSMPLAEKGKNKATVHEKLSKVSEDTFNRFKQAKLSRPKTLRQSKYYRTKFETGKAHDSCLYEFETEEEEKARLMPNTIRKVLMREAGRNEVSDEPAAKKARFSVPAGSAPRKSFANSGRSDLQVKKPLKAHKTIKTVLLTELTAGSSLVDVTSARMQKYTIEDYVSMKFGTKKRTFTESEIEKFDAEIEGRNLKAQKDSEKQKIAAKIDFHRREIDKLQRQQHDVELIYCFKEHHSKPDCYNMLNTLHGEQGIQINLEQRLGELNIVIKGVSTSSQHPNASVPAVQLSQDAMDISEIVSSPISSSVSTQPTTNLTVSTQSTVPPNDEESSPILMEMITSEARKREAKSSSSTSSASNQSTANRSKSEPSLEGTGNKSENHAKEFTMNDESVEANNGHPKQQEEIKVVGQTSVEMHQNQSNEMEVDDHSPSSFTDTDRNRPSSANHAMSVSSRKQPDENVLYREIVIHPQATSLTHATTVAIPKKNSTVIQYSLDAAFGETDFSRKMFRNLHKFVKDLRGKGKMNETENVNILAGYLTYFVCGNIVGNIEQHSSSFNDLVENMRAASGNPSSFTLDDISEHQWFKSKTKSTVAQKTRTIARQRIGKDLRSYLDQKCEGECTLWWEFMKDLIAYAETKELPRNSQLNPDNLVLVKGNKCILKEHKQCTYDVNFGLATDENEASRVHSIIMILKFIHTLNMDTNVLTADLRCYGLTNDMAALICSSTTTSRNIHQIKTFAELKATEVWKVSPKERFMRDKKAYDAHVREHIQHSFFVENLRIFSYRGFEYQTSAIKSLQSKRFVTEDVVHYGLVRELENLKDLEDIVVPSVFILHNQMVTHLMDKVSKTLSKKLAGLSSLPDYIAIPLVECGHINLSMLHMNEIVNTLYTMDSMGIKSARYVIVERVAQNLLKGLANRMNAANTSNAANSTKRSLTVVKHELKSAEQMNCWDCGMYTIRSLTAFIKQQHGSVKNALKSITEDETKELRITLKQEMHKLIIDDEKYCLKEE